MIIWIYQKLGDWMYQLNGGLEGLNHQGMLYKIMIWAWGNAYYLSEKRDGRLPAPR